MPSGGRSPTPYANAFRSLQMTDASREDVLAYMAFPREHWPQIASTNPIERVNGEVNAGPTSSAFSLTSGRSFASSARSCSNKLMSGR